MDFLQLRSRVCLPSSRVKGFTLLSSMGFRFSPLKCQHKVKFCNHISSMLRCKLKFANHSRSFSQKIPVVYLPLQSLAAIESCSKTAIYYIYIYTSYPTINLNVYTESESFKEYQVDCKSYLPKVIPGPQHIQKTSLGGPTATNSNLRLGPSHVNQHCWKRHLKKGSQSRPEDDRSVCWKSLTKLIDQAHLRCKCKVRWEGDRWDGALLRRIPCHNTVVALCVYQTMENQRRTWRIRTGPPTLSWLG